MDLDVITIGGGVGGSTLASALARSGRQVVVLEREREFKDRVPGKNILPWASPRRGGLECSTSCWRQAVIKTGPIRPLRRTCAPPGAGCGITLLITRENSGPPVTHVNCRKTVAKPLRVDVLGVIVVSEADAPSCWKILKPERTEWTRWKEARLRPPFAPTI